MGGQVWGGGVIALVAVALWMLYLLPSWQNRHRFHAAERNAVRLNQALRVLAETSETPQEVRLELTARTAAAQQRLARRALAEREKAELVQSRLELEAARAEAAAARAHPAARRARARRRMRLTATVALLAGLAAVGVGVWRLVAAGEAVWLIAGTPLVIAAGVVLQRMAAVAARAARSAASVPVAVRAAAEVPDIAMPAAPVRDWQPRTLPAPLSSAAGSRAASVLDAAEAREALRAAALEEAKRERAARTAPPALAEARAARAAADAAADAASPSPYARMGYVDDAEIEAHVRRLLESRRAS